MFYFCNFLKKNTKGYNKEGVGFVNVSDDLDSHVQLANCYQVEENGVRGLNFVTIHEQSNGEKIDLIGNLSSEKMGCSEKELKSTDENPIIIVSTKKFKVFSGIPTYIKYVPVRDGVIVALIKGYITVEGKNGEMIPLSRNCNALESSEGQVYKAEDIKKLNILNEKESDLPYSEYVVSDCIISLSYAKDGSKLSSVKFNKDNFIILNEGVFAKAKEKRLAEIKAREEERKRKAEENARFNESYRLRMLEEEKKKSEKASSGRTRTTRKKEKVDILSGSVGAQSFLDCVSKLHNEG